VFSLIGRLPGELSEPPVGEVAAGHLDLLHAPDPLTQHGQRVVVQATVLMEKDYI